MRLDRLLTLYFFHPLLKILGQKDGLRISILMYHGISERDEDVRHPYYVTNTRPEVFARHMQCLADNNYNVISLSEAISLLSNQPVTSLPLTTSHETLNTCTSSLATSRKPQATKAQRPVVITFDDGYKDFHDIAWPILKKHSFSATMFLPTGHISNERKRLNGKDCLIWDEIVAVSKEGAEFGAHTVSHIQLYELYKPNLSFLRRQESIETIESIDYELRASKQAIEEKLGKTVDHYSYAYAFPEQDTDFVQYLEQSLRRAGYTGAVSTRIGTAKQGDDLYLLKRIPVNSHDDEGLLRAKLEGGYDWLNRVQVMKKKIRFAG